MAGESAASFWRKGGAMQEQARGLSVPIETHSTNTVEEHYIDERCARLDQVVG